MTQGSRRPTTETNGVVSGSNPTDSGRRTIAVYCLLVVLGVCGGAWMVGVGPAPDGGGSLVSDAWSVTMLLTGGGLMGSFSDESPLFEHTTDAVALLALGGGRPVVRRANDRFADRFAPDDREAAGRATDDLDGFPTLDTDDVRRARAGESFETDHDAGDRTYLVRVVPSDPDADPALSYVVVTDVTDRVRRAAARRERSRVTELLETATRMTNAERPGEVFDLATATLMDTFGYDAVSLSVDGELVRQFGADDPVDPAAMGTVGNGEDSVERTDVEREGGTWARVLTLPLDSRGVIQVARRRERSGGRTETPTEALLATHLGEVLAKIDREGRLEAERDRVAFLNRVLRHNLLNGLNVVQARAEVLEGGVDPEVENHLRTIRTRVADLIDRLEKIRTFVRAFPADDDDLRPVALRDAVRTQVGTVDEVYPDADVGIEGELPAVAIRGDELFREALDSVLSNAIEHNDNEVPTVRVSAHAEGSEATIRVEDDGPGIPESRARSVFEEGVSASDDPNHGVGLYLVSEVVDMYGGDVWVERADLGGAAFCLRLPVAD